MAAHGFTWEGIGPDRCVCCLEDNDPPTTDTVNGKVCTPCITDKCYETCGNCGLLRHWEDDDCEEELVK